MIKPTNTPSNMTAKHLPAKVYLVFMSVAPFLIILERLLRTENGPHFFREYLVELSYIATVFIPALSFVLHLKKIIIAIIVATIVVFVIRHRRTLIGKLKTSFVLTTRKLVKRILFVFFLLISFLLSSFWWLLAGWKTEIAAGLAAPVLLAYAIPSIRRRRWVEWFGLLALSFAGLVLVFLLNLSHIKDVDLADAVNIFPKKNTFDAEVLKNGNIVVSTRSDSLWLHTNGGWSQIADMSEPHHLSVTPDDVVYAGDFNRDTVLRLQNDEVKSFHLGNYKYISDVAEHPGKKYLFAILELYSKIVKFDMVDGKIVQESRTLPFPCQLAIDPIRKRVIVIGELVLGGLTVLDLDDMAIQERRWIGINNWGVAINKYNGNIWITRPVAGEVLVLDSSLAYLKRVRVGCAPRDLAFDYQRECVIVGNYFSGIVSLIDLKTLRVKKEIKLKFPWLYAKLRGVSVGADGQWYAALDGGVWRINPDSHI